jgi:hypothetical protein
MSFILDALKKSESERHRHSGPVLMDVRIAPPRRRLPTWAWVIAGVLLVNLLLLVWLLWLAPGRTPAPTAPAATSPVASPTAPPAAAPQIGVAPAVPSVSAPAVAIPQTTAPAGLPPAAMNQSPPPAVGPNPAAAAGTDPTEPIDTTNLPRVQDLIAAGAALPELRLSLHVYDPLPANRYVLLNGTRLIEGGFTADGLKLVQITPAGVVLEWRGRRMFLSASG